MLSSLPSVPDGCLGLSIPFEWPPGGSGLPGIERPWLSLGLGLAAHLAAAGAEVVMPVRNLARARGGREDQAATTWGISLSPTCCPYCARDARATSQISVAANQHAINWNDLNWERSYHGRRAYSQSKIAFGLFGLELDRRSRAGGWGITSNLRHRVENSRAAGFG